MSMAAIRRAFDERGLKAGTKLVFLSYAWHANASWEAWQGIDTTGIETGLEECAIARHLKILERKGLIKRRRRYNQRGHRLTDAFLLWPSGEDVTGEMQDSMPRISPVNNTDANVHFADSSPANCKEMPGVLQSAYKDEPSTEPRRTQIPIEGDLFPNDSRRSTKRKTRKQLLAKRDTTMPADWPDETLRSEAIKFWRANDRADLAHDIDHHSEQARNNHASKGNRFVDWGAAWRTWYRNTTRFERAPQPNTSGANRGRSNLSLVAEKLLSEVRNER